MNNIGIENMSKKSIVLAGSMLVLSIFVAVPAMAATITKHVKTTHTISLPKNKGKGTITPRANMSTGTVSAINLNGTSFTLTSKKMTKTGTTRTSTPITITVNTNSTTLFKKDGVATTFSALAVGQTVLVNGVKDTNNTIANAISVNINTRPATWPKTTTSTKTGN
jgi:hypothetical protein